MPGDHKDVYVSTTLAIVIVTTFVLGGLTEPMLTSMDMKKKNDHVHNHYSSGDRDLHPRGVEQVRKEPPGGGSAYEVRVSDMESSISSLCVCFIHVCCLFPYVTLLSSTQKVADADLGSDDETETNAELTLNGLGSASKKKLRADYSFLQRIDANYMQPLFGKPQY